MQPRALICCPCLHLSLLCSSQEEAHALGVRQPIYERRTLQCQHFTDFVTRVIPLLCQNGDELSTIQKKSNTGHCILYELECEIDNIGSVSRLKTAFERAESTCFFTPKFWSLLVRLLHHPNCLSSLS